MAAKDFQMDDGGVGVEDIHPQGDNSNGNTTSADGKTKRSHKQQRRRITGGGGGGGGGGGILRNLTRRGSLGSHLNENFDLGDQRTMADSKLVLKCQVKLTENSLTRQRFLFLHEDVLICAKQKSSTSFHIKNRVDLRDIWLDDDDDEFLETDSSSCKTESFRLGWPITNVELEFPTVDEKNSWVEKLRMLLTIIRDKEVPQSIARLVKNDEKYSVTKSLLVGNCESANRVLQRCTTEFHITSDINGYQLQALMSKNETPIPLTGSEILYRIQMKYNREHSHNCKDSTTENEAEPIGDGLVFQLIHAMEKKSTILKRSLANEDIRPAKRVSPLARFFRMTFKMADEGRLYRRNLSELYKDGKLCWRLMMMLSHLYLNGPSYEEVFRKPPALKVYRILQEKLDRGKDFNFDKVNACEMSQLLKSFLSYLPECLLTNELNEEWSEVPKQKTRPAMVSLAKSLVDRLPESNLVFLRHLICVLHRIASHCDINGMPPKSLSICIGQCLLWIHPLKPPNSSSADELHTELYRFGIANTVTEILIENALDIFGEECLHLFDHLLHQKPLSSTKNITRNSNINGPLKTENMNFRGGLSRDTTSSDRSGVIRSISCLNYSTMSLTDETRDTEIELLREVSEEVGLKLNSSWHLSGTTYDPKTPFVGQQREPSLNSSFSSSQLELFPEKRSIRDDDDDEEEEELSIKIESTSESFQTLNRLPGDEERLSLLSEVDTPAKSIHLNSSNDNLTAESNDDVLCVNPSTSDTQSSNNESKSTTAEMLPSSFLEKNGSSGSTHRAVSMLSSPSASGNAPPIPLLDLDLDLDLDLSPVLQMFDFAEDNETPGEVNAAPVYRPTSNNTSDQSTNSQSLTVSQTTKSTKSHPQTLAMSPVKSALVPGCEVESVDATIICDVKNWILIDAPAIETKTNSSPETKISTPDDGYFSSSNTISRGSVTGREFDLSRLERNCLSNPEDLSLTRHCPRTPLDVSRAKLSPSDYSPRSEASTGRSSSSVKSDLLVTPPGIVRRLTGQITQRESSSLSVPPPIPVSPKLPSPRTKFHSPFSPSSKGTSPSVDVCSSSGSIRTMSPDVPATTNEHSITQHSNRLSWKPEFQRDIQISDSGKSRFADQDPASDVKTFLPRDEKNKQPSIGQKSVNHSTNPCDDTRTRSTSFGSCSKVKPSTVSQESTKRNADTLKTTTKPLIELIISSPKPQDSIANIRLTEAGAGDFLQVKQPTNVDSDAVQKKSSKPRLHNSDPKIMAPNGPRQLIERSSSDICGIATEYEKAMNTENKENLLRYQQLKRLSITRQVSTPEKVSKISAAVSNEPGKPQDEVSSCSAEAKNMSVKNRDWHKELTEQYTIPAASVKGGMESQKNVGTKPISRSALIEPKISFTPMPLRVFQGNTSRMTATTTAKKT